MIDVVIEKIDIKGCERGVSVTCTFECGTHFELAEGVITLISCDIGSLERVVELKIQPIITMYIDKDISIGSIKEVISKYCNYVPAY